MKLEQARKRAQECIREAREHHSLAAEHEKEAQELLQVAIEWLKVCQQLQEGADA